MYLKISRPSQAATLRLLLLIALWAGAPLLAEQQDSTPATQLASTADLPDSPGYERQTQTSSTSQSSGDAQQTPAGVTTKQQTKRIAGIMPNFNAVSSDTKLPPQTPKEKFIIAAKNSFDYSSFLLAGIQSGINMATDSYPEFGNGIEGYGKYYYHVLLDTADSNFMVAGLWPVIFRQDNRFYTLGHGGFKKRALYASTRVLITRTDHGNRAFNASEIIGTGSASGVSTLYYPEEYRTWTKVGQKWLTAVLIDSANYTFKEFWPDINNKLSKVMHHKQAPPEPQP